MQRRHPFAQGVVHRLRPAAFAVKHGTDEIPAGHHLAAEGRIDLPRLVQAAVQVGRFSADEVQQQLIQQAVAHIFLFAALRLKADLKNRRGDGHFLLAVVGLYRFRLVGSQRLGRLFPGGEIPFGQLQHRFLLKAARHRKHHVAGAVKAFIAAAQQGSVDLRNGLLGPGNIHPDGVPVVHGLQKVGRHHPFGAVPVHPQLLGYYAPFPPDGVHR